MSSDILPLPAPNPQNIPDDVMAKHSLGLRQKDNSYQIDFVAWADQMFTRVKDENPVAVTTM